MNVWYKDCNSGLYSAHDFFWLLFYKLDAMYFIFRSAGVIFFERLFYVRDEQYGLS